MVCHMYMCTYIHFRPAQRMCMYIYSFLSLSPKIESPLIKSFCASKYARMHYWKKNTNTNKYK